MDLLPRCAVIEWRQYTLHPGRRDELISLFERAFIEPQRAVGLHVLGSFRDADRDDRFVWLRGFTDMASRASGLQAFYDGPVWREHRSAANATMIDSDDVLLLRPIAWPDMPPTRSADGTAWHAVICPLHAAPDAGLQAALRATVATVWLETEAAENNFPRLPVRSGEPVVVGLSPSPIEVPPTLRDRLAGTAAALRLLPTAHSPLR